MAISYSDLQAALGGMPLPRALEPKRKNLSPVEGVDSVRAAGPRSVGDLRFGLKLASQGEVERLRREVDDGLDDVQDALRAIQLEMTAQRQAHAMAAAAAPPPSSPSMFGGNPLMMLMLLGAGGGGGGLGGLTSNPLLLLSLMGQSMSMPVGHVGGQPLALDLGQLALMQLMMNSLQSRSVEPAAKAKG